MPIAQAMWAIVLLILAVLTGCEFVDGAPRVQAITDPSSAPGSAKTVVFVFFVYFLLVGLYLVVPSHLWEQGRAPPRSRE